MMALVECRDVSVGYDKPVLEHVDLRVVRGEIVAVLGGSGSGKSTLMRALIGLQPPLAGEIRLFGADPYALEPAERHALLRRIGVAFQQDALFSSLTLAENVALPLRELTRLPDSVIHEMVRMKLELVGLCGLDKRLPSQISGGQRKRAAFARASILDPEVILCDEPTAGLDPIVAVELEAMLREFRDVLDTTIVVVSHELESVEAIADRAIMLAHHTLHATGTIAELAASRDRTVHDFFHARTG